MNLVVHFEIQADDPARAKAFYEKVFGWELTQWGEQKYWMVQAGAPEWGSGKAGGGINGGMYPRVGKAPAGKASNAYICTIQVDDIDEILEKVKTHGRQQTSEKNTIPGVGMNAMCLDTEGNIFGLLQPRPKADQPMADES